MSKMPYRSLDQKILKILQEPRIATSLSIPEIIVRLKEDDGLDHDYNPVRYSLKVLENTGFVTLYHNIERKKGGPKYLFALNEWYQRRSKLYEMLDLIDKYITPTEEHVIDESLSLGAEYELAYGVYQAWDKLVEKLVDAGVDLEEEKENKNETTDEVLGQ